MVDIIGISSATKKENQCMSQFLDENRKLSLKRKQNDSCWRIRTSVEPKYALTKQNSLITSKLNLMVFFFFLHLFFSDLFYWKQQCPDGMFKLDPKFQSLSNIFTIKNKKDLKSETQHFDFYQALFMIH